MSKESPKDSFDPYSYVEKLVKTGQELVLKPQSFFKNMPTKGGYGQPLLFSITIFFIVLAYNIALIASGLPYPSGQGTADRPITETLTRVPMLGIVWVLGLFLGALILHGAFKLLKGKGNYEATFRIFAYSSIANLLTIIPSVGQYMSSIYTLLLIMFGGRYIHGLSTGRAITAPILPALLLWGVLMGLILTGVVSVDKLAALLKQ